MLGDGWRRKEAHEIFGHAVRLLTAGPGSFEWRHPDGNTSGPRVAALRPVPVPDDLRHVLYQATTSNCPVLAFTGITDVGQDQTPQG
jgi:hypothetical protein